MSSSLFSSDPSVKVSIERNRELNDRFISSFRTSLLSLSCNRRSRKYISMYQVNYLGGILPCSVTIQKLLLHDRPVNDDFNQDIRLVNVRVRPRPPPPENKRVLSYLESTALVVSSVIMINKCRFSSEPINSRLRCVWYFMRGSWSRAVDLRLTCGQIQLKF